LGVSERPWIVDPSIGWRGSRVVRVEIRPFQDLELVIVLLGGGAEYGLEVLGLGTKNIKKKNYHKVVDNTWRVVANKREMSGRSMAVG
jgi:hypothetical protein